MVFPLSGLGHGHIDAMQPFLCMLLVLSFQHIRIAVGEDLKGSRQASRSLPGYNLQKERQAITFRQGQCAAEADARGCAHPHALHFAQLNGDILQLIFLCKMQGNMKRTGKTSSVTMSNGSK